MKTNPILARNVVMLAMRHAIEDSLDGSTQKEREKAADDLYHRRTWYSWALGDYAGPMACTAGRWAGEKLQEMFPGFTFQYRATVAEKQGQPAFKECPDETLATLSGETFTPSYGQGVVVALGDFYVQVPSALTLSAGLFEQPASLRLALQYRDRLSQETIDRSFLTSVRSVAGVGDEGEKIARQIAMGALDEGWGWERRRKSTEVRPPIQ